MYSQKVYSDITYLKGVGPVKAQILKSEFGIVKIEDLLFNFPYRYEDKSQIRKISSISPNLKMVLIQGKIISKNDIGTGQKRRLILTISDGTGEIDLIWFRSIAYIDKQYDFGDSVIAYGRLSVFNGHYNISHPEIEKQVNQQSAPSKMKPFYSATEKSKQRGVDSRFFETITETLINELKEDDIEEIIPINIIKKYRLPSRFWALRWIHHPNSESELQQAIRRFKFEELFLFQLQMVRIKMRTQRLRGFSFDKVGSQFLEFYDKFLPFDLTNAQKRVIKEIRHDTATGFQMNRLLQGDVGSGKTIVALLCMLLALDNGFQACLMAPTEILAQQHFIGFHEMLDAMGIRVALLTGSTKGAERKKILKELSEGEIQIIIGTHALIEKPVQFQNLGLVIIDEQHKFGVAQRAEMSKKNVIAPHILVMTATPIPRSLAMTAFGHMEVSQIDELPPGRKPIETKHTYDIRRIEVMSFIAKQIRLGRQVYIVYPLIEESEKLDYESLERGYEEVKSYFPELRDSISLVHGRQSVDLREINMKRFADGETKILVATTVIEVGVNVPNASVMLIESSERFGLSQLHQLRGRVGRGADQSYCILMTAHKLSDTAKKRIGIMVETNDGFRIAKVDMEIRGPGELIGTRQSGMLDFRLANIAEDEAILMEARHSAIQILEDDPELVKSENQKLKIALEQSGKRKWMDVL